MQLIIKLTAQIKDMESQLDILMKEKETVKETDASTIPTFIPIIIADIPSTLGENLAPKELLATAVSVQSGTTSQIESSTSQVQQTNDVGKIFKSMEEMKLKTKEINSLKKTIQTMEVSNKATLINANNYEKKAKRLEEQVKSLQKDLSFTTQISYIKNHLWTNIIEAIHLQCPSI